MGIFLIILLIRKDQTGEANTDSNS